MKKCNLFYLGGLLFFLAAVLNLVTGENHSTAVVWLCLGSSSLCLGYSQQKKSSIPAAPAVEKSGRGCNSLRGLFVFQTEQRNFDKDEVRVCQQKLSNPLLRPALT